MKTYGASTPLKELQRKFGFEPERIVATAKEQLVGKVPGLATAEAIRLARAAS